MGTCIEAVATAHGRGGLLARGALHLSDEASRRCLAQGHHRAEELDLLINVGIYKDHNVAEPALASIIQEDLGANPGHPPRRHHHGTFSFDLLDGGCGVITAMQLVDGFVGGGPARTALVVAADADPSPRSSRGFRFRPVGGALLLAHAEGGAGFVAFAHRTFPEEPAGFAAHLRWDPRAGLRHRGRNLLEITESPGFAAACVAHAIEVAREFLADAGVRANQVELLIGSQVPGNLAVEVAHGLGIPAARVPRVGRELRAAHTAGPLAALEAAVTAGRFPTAGHTLFVTAGAGTTIALALYRGAGR